MNQPNPQVSNLSVANFKTGSYIMIENRLDKGYFYIIRSGKVHIHKSMGAALGTNNSVLGPGDFFGVVGAMTGHPRIESCIALENVSLIVVQKNQFGFLIQKNAPLGMKIIRSFSKQLREFDIQLTKRTLKQTHHEDNPDNVYHNGEYYYKNQQDKIAAYHFIQYLKFYPTGNYNKEAKQKLVLLSAEVENYQSKGEINRHYTDGEVLFVEGEPGYELFIIQSGQVKITKIVKEQEILIAVLNPGDILGEMAILDSKNRAAIALSFGASLVTAINIDNFTKIMSQNANLAIKVVTILSERVWTVYKQLANLLLEDPEARIYDTLLTQLLKKHIAIKDGKSYQFTFGVAEITKMLGLDNNKVNVAVQKILKNKKITIVEEKFFCENLKFIEKEVEFALRINSRNIKLKAQSHARLQGR